MPTYGIHFTIIRDGKLRTKNIAVEDETVNAAIDRIRRKYGYSKIWSSAPIKKVKPPWVWLKDDY